ncbi:MAG TPA: carbohydrate porin [Terriglobia bacterium]|nr:carbohydrate porin [Terriglobia bacterium]
MRFGSLWALCSLFLLFSIPVAAETQTGERWNAHGQFTYISSWKPSFSARYTNLNGSPNSLLPIRERSFTGTMTLYLGARPWKGAEVYYAPELISQQGFSQLRGLGAAIQNFELQKTGQDVPKVYNSRYYIKQSFGLGGERTQVESGQQQLATEYNQRRIVVAAGKFSLLDFFDKNAFGIDPRQGLVSLSFMTYGAWDFAADARGYSFATVGEFYWDDWSARIARATPPKEPNQLPVDFRLGRYFGDQAEVAHKHRAFGQDGAVRVLAYRNRENIGKFSDAVAAFEADPQKNATTCPGFNYGSQNPTAPDLCWVRKPNVKMGVGVFGEQYIARDIGVFGRAMYSDGKTEVDAYTATDRNVSFGLLAKGTNWGRPADVAGVALNLGYISSPHAQYLKLGGIDGFIGDGTINPGVESAFDMFYSVNVWKPFWVSGDYQHIGNPAFNKDRGPVNVFTVRVHGEF